MPSYTTLDLPVFDWVKDRTAAAKALLNGALAVRIGHEEESFVSQVLSHMPDATGRFLALSREDQECYRLLRPPFLKPEDCEDGWIRKRYREKGRETDLGDDKVYYQDREMLPALLSERGLSDHWFHSLRETASVLRRIFYPVVFLLVEELAKLSSRPELVQLLRGEEREFVVRVLHYLKERGIDEEPDPLGEEHNDRSFLTAQLGDTSDGLTLINRRGDKEYLIEMIPGTAIVFFGWQGERFFANSRYPVRATRHRIVDTRNLGDETLRGSIVAFAHIEPPEVVMRISGKNGYPT